MKKLAFVLLAMAVFSCQQAPQTPEEKVSDLLTARFDSLALNCKVVSVQLTDTVRAKLTTADPGYKQLVDNWRSLMDARVSPTSPEYVAARQAMKDYESNWIGQPLALKYSCIVDCEDAMLKAMVESGEFAISLDHSKIIELQ